MTTPATRFIASYHHTPLDGYRHIFHSVLRAGHTRLAPDFQMRSWSRPGHELLLSIAGAGSFRISNRLFTIGTNEIGWVDHRHHDVSWPTRESAWEFLWMRIDSELLQPMTEMLCVDRDPIFAPRKTAEAVAIFRTIFRLLRGHAANMDAAMHAAIGSLMAILLEARQIAVAALDPKELRRSHAAGDRLATVLDTMRRKFEQPWTVEELAQMTGLSASHFFSQFHRATGSSPINWLRRERINQAKRRLCETRDSIHVIAESVGYTDPLYFSRDFRKLVGISPRHYRRQEQAYVS